MYWDVLETTAGLLGETYIKSNRTTSLGSRESIRTTPENLKRG